MLVCAIISVKPNGRLVITSGKAANTDLFLRGIIGITDCAMISAAMAKTTTQ